MDWNGLWKADFKTVDYRKAKVLRGNECSAVLNSLNKSQTAEVRHYDHEIENRQCNKLVKGLIASIVKAANN